MYALSIAIAVNPPGVEPVLTRTQVWLGLELKARDAVPFVPGMTSCDVIEPRPGGFLRRAVYRGVELLEEVRLTPEVEVRFERVGGSGWITNVISDGPDGLLLTFTFAVTFEGIEEGSAAERDAGEQMRGAYVEAVRSTLETVRGLVADGSL